jgi:hypothetical protein
MIESPQDIWEFYEVPNHVILITTNGFVKKNGECVMGRGCALEATQRIPQIASLIGYHIQRNGNVPMRVPGKNILTFPVKHNWWEPADLKLIVKSAEWLAGLDPAYQYHLPRPGCGNGRLNWEDVRPYLEPLPDNVWVHYKE